MPTFQNRQCKVHENKIEYIDYKNLPLLRKFTTKYYKIVPRYYSGTCLKHQKAIARAIKNARQMGLLPFTSR
ncbi:30S ribosomal protein S18 [Candidatus Peregrinibacteria bacterium]|nr:30S ribosomal protein S18 [Candidatus Peregrinibacteria bacterium]